MDCDRKGQEGAFSACILDIKHTGIVFAFRLWCAQKRFCHYTRTVFILLRLSLEPESTRNLEKNYRCGQSCIVAYAFRSNRISAS